MVAKNNELLLKPGVLNGVVETLTRGRFGVDSVSVRVSAPHTPIGIYDWGQGDNVGYIRIKRRLVKRGQKK